MKLLLIVLAVVGLLVTVVLYACLVVGARWDEASERQRKMGQQKDDTDLHQ